MKRIRTLSTSNIADVLDVTRATVARWIDNKEIVAFITPGGHRKVSYLELVRFLKSHKMCISKELRKMNTKNKQ